MVSPPQTWFTELMLLVVGIPCLVLLLGALVLVAVLVTYRRRRAAMTAYSPIPEQHEGVNVAPVKGV